MNYIRYISLFILMLLAIVQLTHAELIDNSSVRYKETTENSLIFSVSKEHAQEIIEPQVSFHWTLDKYKDASVMLQLTDYVIDHSQYALKQYYGLEANEVELGRIYIGTPSTLPEGMIFVSEVKVKKGLFWNKMKVGFIIPSVNGFEQDEIVYFIYNG